MAALGWLLNLDFAGSVSAAAAATDTTSVKTKRITIRQYSWNALVNKIDPEHNKPDESYVFSSGRKFFNK